MIAKINKIEGCFSSQGASSMQSTTKSLLYNSTTTECMDVSKHNLNEYKELLRKLQLQSQLQSQEVFKKYTGIFAISNSGVLGWDLYEKSGIDSDRLYEFLEKHITKKTKIN